MKRVELVGGPHDGRVVTITGGSDEYLMPELFGTPTKEEPTGEAKSMLRYRVYKAESSTDYLLGKYRDQGVHNQ